MFKVGILRADEKTEAARIAKRLVTFVLMQTQWPTSRSAKVMEVMSI